MPFSFFLHLYERFQEKHAEDFDRQNKVLTPGDIRALLQAADRTSALRVLRSAVTDHHPVNGIPYHLRYPVNELFYHDRFKRALIADGIGRALVPVADSEWEDALAILDALADPGKNAGFVVILAWDALGRLSSINPEVPALCAAGLRRSLGGTVGSVIGALIFSDHARRAGMDEEVLPVLVGAGEDVRFRLQKVLYWYYRTAFATVAAGPGNRAAAAGPGIIRFVQAVRAGRRLTEADLFEGLVQVDLLGANQERAFWDNTPHAEIGGWVTAAGGEYLKIAGAYTNDIYPS